MSSLEIIDNQQVKISFASVDIADDKTKKDAVKILSSIANVFSSSTDGDITKQEASKILGDCFKKDVGSLLGTVCKKILISGNPDGYVPSSYFYNPNSNPPLSSDPGFLTKLPKVVEFSNIHISPVENNHNLIVGDWAIKIKDNGQDKIINSNIILVVDGNNIIHMTSRIHPT